MASEYKTRYVWQWLIIRPSDRCWYDQILIDRFSHLLDALCRRLCQLKRYYRVVFYTNFLPALLPVSFTSYSTHTCLCNSIYWIFLPLCLLNTIVTRVTHTHTLTRITTRILYLSSPIRMNEEIDLYADVDQVHTQDYYEQKHISVKETSKVILKLKLKFNLIEKLRFRSMSAIWRGGPATMNWKSTLNNREFTTCSR